MSSFIQVFREVSFVLSIDLMYFLKSHQQCCVKQHHVKHLSKQCSSLVWAAGQDWFLPKLNLFDPFGLKHTIKTRHLNHNISE